MRTRRLHWGIALGLLLCVRTTLAQDTATATPTETWTPTASWTPTSTWTPTATWTPTPTWTATWTPVVQTVVTQPALVVTAPPVVITSPPIVLTAVPAAPSVPLAPAVTSAPVIPLAPAPTLMTPFYGWQRYQSIYFIQVIGAWSIQNDTSASARQFRMSSSARAIARYPFTGDGVRVAYQASPQGCLFDVVVDTRVVATLDSHADITEWRLAGPYFLSSGYHVLDIRSQAQESGVCAVAFDYIDVFSNPPLPAIALTGAAPSLTDVPRQDVVQVVLVSQPPTPVSSPTTRPASVVSLMVQVAYDANANTKSDLGEGVQGLSIRVMNAVTGELLHSGFTDERGVVRFQVVSSEERLVTIPLLARTFSIRPTLGRTAAQTWDVLLPPANQPAVIP
jgi:hypothetical protein